MKVLVTGGAGFIGSSVSKLLLNQKHEVTVIDNLSNGHKNSLDPKVEFYQADLDDQKQLEEALAGQNAVTHMASFIEVGESVKKPVEFAQNNIVGTVKLLEAMKNVRGNFQSETIIAGGDTIELVRKYGNLEDYSHISLAGGATLEFLAGKTLPALVPLITK